MIAVRHFEAYAEMDKSRFIFADQLLESFFLQHDNASAAVEVNEIWNDKYPEKTLFDRAATAKREGRQREAIELYRAALVLNPAYANAYNNMGNSLRAIGLVDSALLCQRTAMALRPHYAPVLYNLGITYTITGDLDKAGELLRNSYELDPKRIEPLLALVALAKQLGRHDDYFYYLETCGNRKDAPVVLLKEFGDLLKSQGRVDEANKIYRRAQD